jgi:hypothetical protein
MCVRVCVKVTVDDALVPLGGRAAARAFSRETLVGDLAMMLPSLLNTVSVPGAARFAHVVGPARVFVACPFALALDLVGGIPVLLKLVSDAQSSEYFAAAIALCVLLIQQSPRNVREMERLNGYQVGS